MEGHCYTCNGITAWGMRGKGQLTYGGIANIPRYANTIAQAEADTGGYWCAVCGERPWKQATRPGRQRWPWEGEAVLEALFLNFHSLAFDQMRLL